MILIRMILSFLIIKCSCKIGNQIASLYVDRENNLNEFKRNFEIVKNRIEYSYEPLDRIFSYVGNISDSVISSIFKEASYSISKNDPKEVWKSVLNKKNLSLEKEDIKVIEDFGNNLGKTEKNGQISSINLTLELIDAQIGQARKIREKNETLYKKLGVIAGIMICVILM